MPAQPINAPMPEDLDLPDGYVIQWNAVDPATGANVAGVVVTDVSIFGTALGSAASGSGTFSLLDPRLLSVQVT